MIDIQHEEFICYRFIHNVFAVMALSENMVKELANVEREVTSDYLMNLHFGSLKKKLRVMLDDPAMVEAFKRRYPTRQDLLTLAEDQCGSLDRLHTVRMELIMPHVDATGLDVHNHHEALREQPPEMTKQDRAAMHGLTVPQFNTWKDQVSGAGYVHLGMAERLRLRDAIVAEHPTTAV